MKKVRLMAKTPLGDILSNWSDPLNEEEVEQFRELLYEGQQYTCLTHARRVRLVAAGPDGTDRGVV